MLWFSFARRYMFSPKSHSVINIIAVVSVVAVAVPTAAMVILLAMFGGLSRTIEDIYSAVDADIEVVASQGQTIDTESLNIEELRLVDGVSAVAPYIEQEVVASAHGRRTTFTLRGVDDGYSEVLPLADYIERGSIEAIGRGELILGYGIAASLSSYGLGSEIEIYALNRRPLSTLLPISGISHEKFRLGALVLSNSEINTSIALTNIEQAQRLMNYKGRISGVAIKLHPTADAYAVEHSLEELLGEGVDVRTREEKNASMNAILRMEKYMIALIGAMIALVATFAIVGSVVMLITDKRRDIATLRALGATEELVRNIFVGEGMLLTLLGCLGGLICGIGVALGQQHFGWIEMPGVSMLDSYPVDISFGDTAAIVAIILAMGLAISYFTVRERLDKE